MASDKTSGRTLLGAAALAMLTACATEPTAPPPAAPPPPAPTTQPPPPPPRPAPPRQPTEEDKRRAEQLANDAVLQLQAGEQANGQGLLEQALALDPGNALTIKMMQQLTTDPVAAYGATHFTYTIQRDDTLAKLAQRFMGDRLLFYGLARYNDITQPNRIHVGQVIKIPGKAPRTVEPPPVAEPVKPAPPAPPPPPPPAVDDQTAKKMAEARELERKGDLEGALVAYGDVLRREPGHVDARQRAVAVRRKLVDRYHAEGTAAFARQDLDKAIAAWDRVLVLDPENQNARLKRQQAIDLKERLKRFDGGKK